MPERDSALSSRAAAALLALAAGLLLLVPGHSTDAQTSSGGIPERHPFDVGDVPDERDGSTDVTVTAVLRDLDMTLARSRGSGRPTGGHPDQRDGVSHGSSCLRGDVTSGFSLVVHAGGPFDGLEDCARARGVTAIYALREGRYVP